MLSFGLLVQYQLVSLSDWALIAGEVAVGLGMRCAYLNPVYAIHISGFFTDALGDLDMDEIWHVTADELAAIDERDRVIGADALPGSGLTPGHLVGLHLEMVMAMANGACRS